MPLIDVNDILLDPDVAGQLFTVIRRQEIVNSFGESAIITKTIPGVVGSIQPDGDNDVIREGDADAQAKSVIIATPFRLRGVSKGLSATRYKPDIIISDIMGEPNMFEVTSIIGWNAFGRGFIEARATTIPWLDYFPAPGLPYYGRLDFSQPQNSAWPWGAGAVGAY